jgi:aryl-alcohol dehydrogenase-like predicted oxidoreductase
MMDMRYRTLGKTGFKVSEIGFGSWQLSSGDSWVGSDKEESKRSLVLALENGVNFIDTALEYGHGLSERWIGEVLKEWKGKKPYIATKIYPKNRRWPAPSDVAIEEVFPEGWIHEAVEISLKNLGVEQIDLMQFHVWQDYFSETDYWKKAVKEITDEGKVRYWGLSLNDYQPMNCVKTLDTGLISTIQLIFNVFHQEPIDTIFPIAKKKDIGIIARVPLDEGGLTGKIKSDTKFMDGDFRNTYFNDKRRAELERRMQRLADVSKKEVSSMAELALRFILSFDAVSTTIPGMRRLAQASENTSVSDKGKLTPALVAELRKHAWERNFYDPSW